MVKQTKLPRGKTTPLIIISLFVTLVEAALGAVITQTSSTVQLALTGFVIGFPLLVAAAFFAILWNRPYVLYSPTEYGDCTSAPDYISALRNGLGSGRQKGESEALALQLAEAREESIRAREELSRVLESLQLNRESLHSIQAVQNRLEQASKREAEVTTIYELQTHLQALLAGAENLARRIDREQPESLRARANKLLASALLLQQLISKLVDEQTVGKR